MNDLQLAIFGLGVSELVIILIIILVVFGAGRIPETLGSLGKGINSFRKAVNAPDEIDVTPSKDGEGSEKDDQEKAPPTQS